MRIAVRTVPLSILGLMLLTLSACQSKPATPAADTSQPPYVLTATIKELMENVVDPNADVVWQSVSAVSNEKGLQEIRPQTDEDWEKVHHAAVTIAEASNLLMMPGRTVARPGEKSETPGVELEPSEMQALIDKDRPGFYERAGALRQAAVEVLAAIDKKDPDAVFDLGEKIDTACENCHKHYWYPNEQIPPLPDVIPEGAPATKTTTKKK
jgi:cytochrome c556